MKKTALFLCLCSIMAVFSGCFGPGLTDYSYSVGTGYQLVCLSGNHITVIPKNGTDETKPEIKAKVVQIAWNDQYVLAKQVGLKKAHPENPKSTYEIPDPNIVRYYILDTTTPKLYGAYDEKAFLKQKKALGISDRLVLKDVDHYAKDK